MRPLVLVLSLLCCASAQARECVWYSANGPSVYNLADGLDEGYASHVDDAELAGLRLNLRIDGRQAWDATLFAQYDDYLARAKAHGFEILGIVLNESTPLGQSAWNDDADGDGWNPYAQQFVDIAKQLMDRYGDQVKYWEIWNEPNCWSSSGYRQDPQSAGCTYILPRVWGKLLTEVFVQAHATIQAKGLHLVSGGLFAHDIGGGFSPATDYLTEVYDLSVWDWLQANYGRRYPWDLFGYHIYIDQGGSTSSTHLAQYLDAIATLRSQRGDSSPLWMTEFGWSTSNMNEATQAANLDTALTLFESRAEVGRTFMFKVENYDGWGLFRSDWTRKPAVDVYRNHVVGCTGRFVPPDAGSPGLDAAAPGLDGAAVGSADADLIADAHLLLDDASLDVGVDSALDCVVRPDASTKDGGHDASVAASCGCGASGPGAAIGALGLLAFLFARRRS